MSEQKTDVRSMSLSELKAYMQTLGEKSFRASQVFDWMHGKQVRSFEEMTNLSAALRQTLSREATLRSLKQVDVRESQIDGTKKFLFMLEDGHVIESVFMRYHHGNSVCISSQVGCRMGCRFCASTIGGRIRNLSASEMLGQIYEIMNLTGERIANIVIMGTGEPLDNYDSLLRFISLISDPKGLNLSQRSITVSTCGLVPQIYELAKEKLQITLALSLHASDQETRQTLMPIANRYELHEVLDACRHYFDETGRRISFEYSLVSGVNDSADHADRLSRLLKGINCHVNLIPVNPVKERDYTRPDRERILAFQHRLEKGGITATIRREMGKDIDGACGQLRRSYMNEAAQQTVTDEPEE